MQRRFSANLAADTAGYSRLAGAEEEERVDGKDVTVSS
jgi:hypothetical protein